MLGDQPRPCEDLLEVALRQPLALGDHAEAVGAGGLGRLRVLEDLLRLHHRVHRRVRLGVARLGAEAAVLGAAARLRVHQRAEVGRVAEALRADLPGALDQRPDLVVVGELCQGQRLVERHQRRHPESQSRLGIGRPGRGSARVEQPGEHRRQRAAAQRARDRQPVELGLEAGLASEALLVADDPGRRSDHDRVEGAARLRGERQDRLRLRELGASRRRSARPRRWRRRGSCCPAGSPRPATPPASHRRPSARASAGRGRRSARRRRRAS